MPTIGVRELKIQASEIIRQVREQRVEYVITYRGEPVAVLMPIDMENQEAMTIQQALVTQTLRMTDTVDLAAVRRRALALAGRFDAGVVDMSTDHDRYAAEAFEV